jgi:hypothetical protein
MCTATCCCVCLTGLFTCFSTPRSAYTCCSLPTPTCWQLKSAPLPDRVRTTQPPCVTEIGKSWARVCKSMHGVGQCLGARPQRSYLDGRVEGHKPAACALLRGFWPLRHCHIEPCCQRLVRVLLYEGCGWEIGSMRGCGRHIWQGAAQPRFVIDGVMWRGTQPDRGRCRRVARCQEL